MAINTQKDYYPVTHKIDTLQIWNTSQLVTKKTGMVIQPNKAIVGANAFAHESVLLLIGDSSRWNVEKQINI